MAASSRFPRRTLLIRNPKSWLVLSIASLLTSSVFLNLKSRSLVGTTNRSRKIFRSLRGSNPQPPP